MSHHNISIFQLVKIHSIVKMAGLNGHDGRVLKVLENGRLEVEVPYLSKTFSLSASNLVLANSESEANIDSKLRRNCNSLATLKQTNEMLKNFGLTDDRFPNFYEEYCLATSDSYWLLEEGFEIARSNPIHSCYLHSAEKVELQKRWGGKNDLPEFNEWINRAKNGEANFHNVKYNPLEFAMCQCFSNMSNELLLLPNCSHVSVGFVDFGELLYCIDTNTENSNIRWFGYELSPYCVAKSLVLLEMLKSTCAIDCIIQIAYSSVWSKESSDSFRNAVATLLQSGNNFSDDVKMFLAWWNTCYDINIKDAKMLWQLHHAQRGIARLIANFKLKADRLALCRYCSVGQLLDGDSGSVVMFSLPYGYTTALDLNVLQTVPFSKLMSHLPECDNVVDKVVTLLRSGFLKLRQLISSEKLHVEVHHCKDLFESKDSARLIHELNPTSMSWSNICDYFTPTTFLETIRRCSGDNTKHFMYFMNWPSKMKGVHGFDYSVDQCKIMLPLAIADISSGYGNFDCLLQPPVEFAYNILAQYLTKLYVEKWKNKFMENGQAYGVQMLECTASCDSYSPFQRMCGVIHLTCNILGNVDGNI